MPAVTGFSPTNISDLIAWYDASDTTTITESGGDVSQWDDKSGNGNHLTQGSSTEQPGTGNNTQNGLNVLDHDGTEYLQRTTFVGGALSQPTTVFLAADTSTAASDYYFDSANTSNRQTSFLSGGNDVQMFAGAVLGFSGNPGSGTFDQLTFLFDTTSSEFWVNGTSQGTGSVGSQTMVGFTEYARFNGAQASIGDVGEIIIYDKELTTTERQQVETYLKDKWGTP